MNLTLSGSLPDTEPALYLIYTRPDSGGVDDGANRLESANVTVSDGIAPTAGSVRATTSRENHSCHVRAGNERGFGPRRLYRVGGRDSADGPVDCRIR